LPNFEIGNGVSTCAVVRERKNSPNAAFATTRGVTSIIGFYFVPSLFCVVVVLWIGGGDVRCLIFNHPFRYGLFHDKRKIEDLQS